LKLGVLVKAIGILAVAAVGGPTTGLPHTRREIACGRARAGKFPGASCLRRLPHRRAAEVRNPASPKLRELQNQILEIEAPWLFLKFYLVFKCSQKFARPEPSFEVVLDPAQSGVAQFPSSRLHGLLVLMRSSPSPAKRSAKIPRLDVQRLPFRGGGTSRKKARAGARRKKPASRRMACRKQRSGRTSAAIRPAYRPESEILFFNSPAASPIAGGARPRLPAESAGTRGSRLHAPARISSEISLIAASPVLRPNRFAPCERLEPIRPAGSAPGRGFLLDVPNLDVREDLSVSRKNGSSSARPGSHTGTRPEVRPRKLTRRSASPSGKCFQK